MSGLPPGVGPALDEGLPPGVGPALGEEPGVGESLLRGGVQGATLNLADEATGAGEALLDKLRGAHEALGELYIKHRDESRAKYKAAQEANPIAYGAGEIGGGVAGMALVPGLGAGGVVAQGAKMAAMGAVAGAGASEAQDAETLVKDSAVSGLIGGAAGVGGALLGKGLAAMGPGLRESADKGMLAAAGEKNLGAMSRQEISERAGQLESLGISGPTMTTGRIAKAAKGLVKDGKESYVGALGEADTALGTRVTPPAAPAGPSLHQFAEGLGLPATDPRVAAAYTRQVSSQAGERAAVASPGITGNSLADHLEEKVAKVARANPAADSRTIADSDRAIEALRAKGDAPISFDDADRMAQQFRDPDLANATRTHIGDKLGELNPALAERYTAGRQLMGRAGDFGAQAEAATKSAGFQIPYSATHAVAQAARFGAKSLGPAVKGSVLDKLAKIAQTNPQALGKYGAYLGAAAARGPAALATTHYTLSQNDKEYAAQVRLQMDRGNE